MQYDVEGQNNLAKVISFLQRIRLKIRYDNIETNCFYQELAFAMAV